MISLDIHTYTVCEFHIQCIYSVYTRSFPRPSGTRWTCKTNGWIRFNELVEHVEYVLTKSKWKNSTIRKMLREDVKKLLEDETLREMHLRKNQRNKSPSNLIQMMMMRTKEVTHLMNTSYLQRNKNKSTILQLDFSQKSTNS
jgi:hypothetical protein